MQFHGKLLDMTNGIMEKIWICVILINSFWSQVLIPSYQKKKINNIRDYLHFGSWTLN